MIQCVYDARKQVYVVICSFNEKVSLDASKVYGSIEQTRHFWSNNSIDNNDACG